MEKIMFGVLIVGGVFIQNIDQKGINDYYVQNPDGTYRLITGNIYPQFCEAADGVCMYVQTTNENFQPILTALEVQELADPPFGTRKLMPVLDPIDSRPFFGIYIE